MAIHFILFRVLYLECTVQVTLKIWGFEGIDKKFKCYQCETSFFTVSMTTSVF